MMTSTPSTLLVPTNKEDGHLVGTSDILTLSKNVVRAPSNINRPVIVPVPSVYEDARGEIHNFCIGRKRFNILYSKAATMRSGDIHKDVQNDFIFKGKVRVWLLTKDGTTSTQIYTANQYIEIPKYVPHVFEFLEDTVMAEWWDTPFEAWFYEPYRKIVQESITTSSSSKNNQGGGGGKFMHYVLQEENERPTGKFLWSWTTTAGILVLGITIGYVIGSGNSRIRTT